MFFGWWVVVIFSLMRVVGGGVHAYASTIFFLPLGRDLGFSRAAISLAFSMARAQGAISSPFAGYLIDRIGPRMVILVGAILAGLGYILLSRIHSYAAFLLVYIGVISVGFMPAYGLAPNIAINNWFRRNRGLAFSYMISGLALGGAVITPLVALAVHSWGWRTTAIIDGVALAAVGIPAAILMRPSPESMGLRPDGDTSDTAAAGTAGSRIGQEESDHTIQEALRTSSFWVLAIASMVRNGAFIGILVHFVPILVWKGIDEQRAAVLLGIMAAFSIPMNQLIGWLSDRISKPRILTYTGIFAIAAVLFLLPQGAGWNIWVFIVLYSMQESLFPVTSATLGEFFGRRRFGTIQGFFMFVTTWGVAIAPVFAGAVYDRYQTYTPALLTFFGLFILSNVLFAFLRYPKPITRKSA